MYLLATARKGISSLQLSKEIGITQKSAWFVLQRLREACGNDPGALSGIVEVDETYIGGKEPNKHAAKKLHAGVARSARPPSWACENAAADAPWRNLYLPRQRRRTAQGHCRSRRGRGPTLHTDEAATYGGIGGLFFKHETINHVAGEYSRDRCVTTNGIESVWAMLKRGVYDTFHHVNPKHLGRYVNEFAFRLNEGNVKRMTLARLDSFIAACAGRRITYRALTARTSLSRLPYWTGLQTRCWRTSRNRSRLPRKSTRRAKKA